MKIFGDYHTHTIYSHGKGTIEDNIKAALSKGLKEIVISDHGPGHYLYGVKSTNLPIMRKEIDVLQKKYTDIKIMLGVEANIISLNGDIDVTKEELKLLDKLLVGFHYGAFGKNLSDNYKLFVRPRVGKVISALKESNKSAITEAIIKAITRHNIDVLTHPGDKTPVNIYPIADIARRKGTLLEINSGHGHLTVEDAKIACEVGADFIINSDAHRPEDVGNFTRAIDIATKAGIPLNRIKNVEI